LHENKLLSSTVAHLVHTVLQAAITNCMALQDLPGMVGIHEIKKSNVAVEWIPALLCIWDVRNPETNSNIFPVFLLKSYRQMPSFFPCHFEYFVQLSFCHSALD
jgi:hypothetical protein